MEVSAEANHITNDKAYVSVTAFASLFDFVSVEENGDTVTVNGKVINDTKVVNGVTTAWVRDLANAVDAKQVSWDSVTREAYILALPIEIIPLHEHTVPGMGVHYANPADLEKGGPVYCVHEGKLHCFEYIIPTELFDNMVNFKLEAMKGYPSPAVVDVHFDYNATHNPFDHYAIHLYFTSADERAKIK